MAAACGISAAAWESQSKAAQWPADNEPCRSENDVASTAYSLFAAGSAGQNAFISAESDDQQVYATSADLLQRCQETDVDGKLAMMVGRASMPTAEPMVPWQCPQAPPSGAFASRLLSATLFAQPCGPPSLWERHDETAAEPATPASFGPPPAGRLDIWGPATSGDDDAVAQEWHQAVFDLVQERRCDGKLWCSESAAASHGFVDAAGRRAFVSTESDGPPVYAASSDQFWRCQENGGLEMLLGHAGLSGATTGPTVPSQCRGAPSSGIPPSLPPISYLAQACADTELAPGMWGPIPGGPGDAAAQEWWPAGDCSRAPWPGSRPWSSECPAAPHDFASAAGPGSFISAGGDGPEGHPAPTEQPGWRREIGLQAAGSEESVPSSGRGSPPPSRAGARRPTPGGPADPKAATTLVVRNLPGHATQQGLLDEVNRSGFAGTYDFAYLPRCRDSGRGAGHAFINFKSSEFALAFKAAWHGSCRLGMAPGPTTLNVAASAVQGFSANVAKWSADRLSQVKNATFLPFISREVEHAPAEGGQLQEGDATTFVVRNLPSRVTQQEFLEEVNRSGFAGMYDYAYLPRSRDTGCGCGHAFVNFKTHEAGVSFIAGWHASARFGMGATDVALNVVVASVQGFDANMARWPAARAAKVKNPKFLPFVSRAVETTAAPVPR